MIYKWDFHDHEIERLISKNIEISNKKLSERIKLSQQDFAIRNIMSNSPSLEIDGVEAITILANNREEHFFTSEIIQRLFYLRQENIIRNQFSQILSGFTSLDSNMADLILTSANIHYLVNLYQLQSSQYELLMLTRSFGNMIFHSKKLTMYLIQERLPRLAIEIARDTFSTLDSFKRKTEEFQKAASLMQEIIYLFASFFSQEKIFFHYDHSLLDLVSSFIIDSSNYDYYFLDYSFFQALKVIVTPCRITVANLFISREVVTFLYYYISSENKSQHPSLFHTCLQILDNFSSINKDINCQLVNYGFFDLHLDFSRFQNDDISLFIHILMHISETDFNFATLVLNSEWLHFFIEKCESFTSSMKVNLMELFATIVSHDENDITKMLISLFPNIISCISEVLFEFDINIISKCLKAINIIANYAVWIANESGETGPIAIILESLRDDNLMSVIEQIMDVNELPPNVMDSAQNILNNLSP